MNNKRWPLRPLGDCAKFLSGGTPSKARAEFWEGDIPWVSSGEMTETRIHDTPLRITADGAEDGSRLVPENTVLAVVRGMSLAKEFRVAISKREVAFNQDLKAFDCKPDVEPEFLFYALFARREHIRELATEASHGTKKLETHTLAAVELPMPKPEIQRRTVEVASAYDELLENNRRRMGLLEEAARLLYREWFVRLRFPGHEHTRITNGVPDRWERVQLQSIINVTHGYAFLGSHFSEEPTSKVLATPGNFRIGGGIKFDKLKFYSEEGPLEPAYVFEPMDLMLTMTDLSKTCDTLGFPAFVPKLNGCSFLHNQRVGRVVPLGKFFPKHFLYCLFCDDHYRHHVVGAATGTSVKHTSPKRILSYTTAMPKGGTLIDAFEDFAHPVFQQINVLIEANQKLRAARDLLLPRLMSGEIVP